MWPQKTNRQPSSNALPADVLVTLPELQIDVEKIAGDEAWALCPGHELTVGRSDQSASWSINLETGEHFCFSCGWGGNYVDLVRLAMGWEPGQAELWVRKHGGISVAGRKMRGEVGYRKKRAEEVSEVDMVMYSDPPAWALEERDLERDSCTAYGVRWDEAKDRWILPIREPSTGKLLGWQAKGKNFFLNHPENLEKGKCLFGYDLLGEVGYLEESPLDCVRLHTYGIDGAVSGYGVHVSDTQMELILGRVERLYVCLDNDAPARAREKRIWRAYKGRTRLMFANYEHVQGSNYKKDHGEMTPEEIEYSLENAISSLRYRP